jgi:hypothetical protein
MTMEFNSEQNVSLKAVVRADGETEPYVVTLYEKGQEVSLPNAFGYYLSTFFNMENKGVMVRGEGGLKLSMREITQLQDFIRFRVGDFGWENMKYLVFDGEGEGFEGAKEQKYALRFPEEKFAGIIWEAKGGVPQHYQLRVMGTYFGNNGEHEESQWFLVAEDLETKEILHFSMNGIKTTVMLKGKDLLW